MSLNRCEQQIFEYIGINPDERHFWEEKVRAYASKSQEISDAATRLEGELWRYFVERSAVVPRFKEVADREGLRRMSMRNLADHLLRLWVPPRPAKKPAV